MTNDKIDIWRGYPHKKFKCGNCGKTVWIPIVFGSGAFCGYCDECSTKVKHLDILYFDHCATSKEEQKEYQNWVEKNHNERD